MKVLRKLRPYQEQALEYCRKHQHPALFMKMRLGKTIITIRRIQELNARRVLVVAPNSALGSWQDELALEHEAHVCRPIGSRRKRLKMLRKLDSAAGGYMTDGGIRVWCLLNREAHLSVPEVKDIHWDVVVLDESVFVANPRSQVSKFFTQNFHQVPSRWALTGTPNPETDLQLAQQMIWLNRDFLGYRSFWHFRAQCCVPGWRGYKWEPTPEAKDAIQDCLKKQAFVLSWREAGVTVKKIRQIRHLQLPKRLARSYRIMERDFIQELDGQETARSIWSLTTYHWLRRLAGGFMITEPGDTTPSLIWKGKIDEIVSLLTGELKDEQVVIWFSYKLELSAVHDTLLGNHLVSATMSGDIPVEERDRRRDAFDKGDIQVLCIQEAVARMGMNLSRAGAAIYYSEPLGLLGRQQTEDRTIDVSEERGKLYVHLLTDDTVDDDVYLSNKAKGIRSSLTLSSELISSMKARGNRT